MIKRPYGNLDTLHWYFFKHIFWKKKIIKEKFIKSTDQGFRRHNYSIGLGKINQGSKYWPVYGPMVVTLFQLFDLRYTASIVELWKKLWGKYKYMGSSIHGCYTHMFGLNATDIQSAATSIRNIKISFV